MPSELYIPKGSISLKDMELPQIRLGIQGAMGTGKSWSMLTFPNPVPVSFDRGLGAHIGREIYEVPFYNDTFVRSLMPDSNQVVDRKNALLKFIRTEASKLSAEQTLGLDGSTGIQNAFHAYEEAHPTHSTRTGKKDEYALWANKVTYWGELVELLKTLKCHVVYIAHEIPDRDNKGEYNGKLRPMLTGQFADQLGSHFTDWVRQLACDKPKDIAQVEDRSLSLWGMTRSEFSAMCDSFPGHTIYYWQLESDDLCNCKVSSLVNFPRYIPANFTSFCKYLRKKI